MCLLVLLWRDPPWAFTPYAFFVITAPLVGIAGLMRARDRHNRRMAALALGLSLVLPLIHLFVIVYFTLIDPLTFDPMD